MASPGRLLEGAYLVVVGCAFIVRGVIALGRPDFWNAVTPLDYAAVWTHSLALLLVAPGLLFLARDAGGKRTTVTVAWVLAAGAVVGALANALEDGLHVEAMGTIYAIAAGLFFYGLLLLAILLARDSRRPYAVVPILTLFGGFLYDAGGGLVIGTTWFAYGVSVIIGRAGRESVDGEPTEPMAID